MTGRGRVGDGGHLPEDKKREVAQQLHSTHHQVSLMVSRNTTLVPSLRLRIGPACEADLSAGMRRERVPPQRRKKKERVENGGSSMPGAVLND